MVRQGETLKTDYCMRNLGGELREQFNDKQTRGDVKTENLQWGQYIFRLTLILNGYKAFYIKEN